MNRLDPLHVTLNTRVTIVRIESKGVLIRSGHGAEKLIAADSVIVAGHTRRPLPIEFATIEKAGKCQVQAKKKQYPKGTACFFGGAKRDRTADLNTASVALSQLS